MAEHPRVGGEDKAGRTADTAVDGTPPRTPAPTSSPPSTTEHPRVGGEDLAVHHMLSRNSGHPESAGGTGTRR
ncbi:hypothetical protein [Streptomyces rochei]